MCVCMLSIDDLFSLSYIGISKGMNMIDQKTLKSIAKNNKKNRRYCLLILQSQNSSRSLCILNEKWMSSKWKLV